MDDSGSRCVTNSVSIGMMPMAISHVHVTTVIYLDRRISENHEVPICIIISLLPYSVGPQTRDIRMIRKASPVMMSSSPRKPKYASTALKSRIHPFNPC